MEHPFAPAHGVSTAVRRWSVAVASPPHPELLRSERTQDTPPGPHEPIVTEPVRAHDRLRPRPTSGRTTCRCGRAAAPRPRAGRPRARCGGPDRGGVWAP